LKSSDDLRERGSSPTVREGFRKRRHVAASKMIIGIVAVDQNLAIGKGGRLPWHYSTDMKFFKLTTIGNAVVMGRRTWLTLKGPLKDRQNIVLSRDQNLSREDSLIALRDVESVISLVSKQDAHLFVIGGAQVYQSFLPHIERWIVTEVPLAVEGADTFMPANFLDGFEMFELRQLDEGLRVKFYERRKPGST
jgi:dihydrofolate reductase